MASLKHLLFLFAILGPSTIILAQESSSAGGESSDVTEASSAAPQDGSSPAVASSAPRLKPFFSLPQIPGAAFFGGGSRQKRASNVKCNYKKQGKSMCTSCNSLRRCNRSNRGSDVTCSGDTPYCKNGRCSSSKGKLCRGTSTTTESQDDSDDSSSSSSSTSSGSSGSSSSSSSSSTSTTASDEYDDSEE